MIKEFFGLSFKGEINQTFSSSTISLSLVFKRRSFLTSSLCFFKPQFHILYIVYIVLWLSYPCFIHITQLSLSFILIVLGLCELYMSLIVVLTVVWENIFICIWALLESALSLHNWFGIRIEKLQKEWRGSEGPIC